MRKFELRIVGGFESDVVDENGYMGFRIELVKDGVVVEKSNVYDSFSNCLYDLGDLNCDLYEKYEVNSNGGDEWRVKMDVLVME